MAEVNPFRDQAIIRTRTDDNYALSRKVPIAHLLVSATTTGGAETLFTVQTDTLFEVKKLTAVNITGSAATITIHAIPSGDSLADANTEIKSYSIAAYTPVDLSDLIGGMYEGGAVLKAYSGTTNAIVLHGHGDEYR